MGHCIYYKKSDGDLRFAKEEHVIPAGLGGRQTLERGIVSDEANEKFSKIEVKVLRNSILALNRINFGPGKRGSFNVNRVKNPIMQVLKDEKSTFEEFMLGFIFIGKNITIPQIIIHFDGNIVKTSYVSTTLIEQDIDNFYLDFDKKLIQFLQNKKRNYKPVQMPFIYMPYRVNKHFVSIGHYQGKWYIATSHKNLNLDFIALTILPILTERASNKLHKPKLLDLDLKYKNQINIDTIPFFGLYLKTAFNALTLFKGKDFVHNEIFDEIRKSIIEVNDLNKFVLPTDRALYKSEIEEYVEDFPDKAHYVIIFSKGNTIIAYVSFYSEFPGSFILTDKYKGEDFIDGLICDWSTKKEFRLGNS